MQRLITKAMHSKLSQAYICYKIAQMCIYLFLHLAYPFLIKNIYHGALLPNMPLFITKCFHGER